MRRRPEGPKEAPGPVPAAPPPATGGWRWLRHAPLALLLACATVLLTWRLGEVYLWQDEAATAVLAERMLRYGKPLAYDGRNVITMDSPADDDLSTLDQRTGEPTAAIRYLVERRDFKPDSTWTNHPWGQFVVTAASFAIFGKGTTQARLPFALASLATVALLHWLAVTTLRDRRAAILATALLVANAFWILHARQCRYYALSSLGLLLSVMGFLRWREGKRWGAALFVLAGWLYFQSDFGSFFPSMAVLGLVALVVDGRRVGRTVAVFGLLGLAVAPWAWYYGIASRVRNAISPFDERFLGTLYNLNQYLIALPLLLLAAWLLWRKRDRLGLSERLALCSSIGVVGSLAVWVPAVAPAPIHRYVVQATPLAALLVAWGIVRLVDLAGARWAMKGWQQAAAIAAAGLLLAATALASAPVGALIAGKGRPFRLLERPELATALGEIFVPRADPNRLTVEALRPLLRPGDEILVNYEDIPLMFYTDALVRGGIPAFRVEDRSAPPPRFLVLRQSVPFVSWPVFRREAYRYRWRFMKSGAPDVPWGNLPDPRNFLLSSSRQELIVAERMD